jgi:hypothetical protein
VIADVILDQARNQIAQQRSKFDRFRGTAGTLLTAAGVVLGFLATQLPSKQSTTALVFASAGAGALALSSIAGALVLAPRKDLIFSEDLDESIDWWGDYGSRSRSEEIFKISLAKNLNTNRILNEPLADHLAYLLIGEAALFTLGVGMWATSALIG